MHSTFIHRFKTTASTCGLRIFSGFLLVMLLTASAAANISVQTRFEPAHVAMGDTARYVVEITETSTSSMPEPEPIESLPLARSEIPLRNGRTSVSRNTQIINFQAEHQLRYALVFDAQPPGEGKFTVSEFTFSYKGQQLHAPAATLTVTERSADAGPAVDELIFLRLEAPERLYVGQTVPVTLKMYISDDMRLAGLNAFHRDADGFTTTDLPDQASESREVVNGHRYRVLSWPMAVTPISAGNQALNFHFTVTAQLPGRERNRRDPLGRSSPFGGSLFDDFFGRASERFNIYTPATEIEVRRLPTTGQPESFSGAIGDFSLRVSADSKTATVGEPIMLSLQVSGRGNLNRINAPKFPETPEWNHYSPQSEIESEDPLGIRGSKRFDYVFIPEEAGSLQLPEVHFAFFDPESETYVKLTSPPIAVEVAPSARPSQPALPAPQARPDASTDSPRSPALSPEQALLTLDYRPSPGRAPDSNLLEQPGFYIANAAALVALIGVGALVVRRRRLREDPNYAEIRTAQLALKSTLARANAAETKGDAEAFYQSAQEAIRLALTKQTGRNYRSADLATVNAALQQRKDNPDACAAARALFGNADAFRFGGGKQPADLSQARQQLTTVLKAL